MELGSTPTPELELELELKPPELELELELELIFWKFAGVGVGVETPGVGVGVEILSTFFINVLFETYEFENWVHHILPNDKTVCLTGITLSEVLKYKDHDFFDFV